MNEKYINKSVIGADETGVGDYFTCLVSAAVFITYDQAIILMNAGVRDSKELSEKQIDYFDSIIRKNSKYEIRHITPKGYNQLNRSFNAHELKTLLHLGAISALEKYNPDLIIVDKYVEEENWNKYIQHLQTSKLEINLVKHPIIFINRAEQEHIAVAAASILARAFMVRKLKEQDKKYGMIFPLGVNERVKEVAREFIKKHGKSELNNVAKISFKTTEEL